MMIDLDTKADVWDVEYLQEQVWELQRHVERLEQENTLLRNDLNTIKMEGCWRFVEDANHKHK